MERPSISGQNSLKRKLKWIMPLVLAILVTVVTYFNLWIEEFYIPYIYTYIALFQRTLTGWLPFSLGDIGYFLINLWLLIRLIKGIQTLIQKKATWKGTLRRTLRLLRFFLWIYILFNALWAWNYHRLGIAYQLQLKPEAYSKEVLTDLTQQLIQKVNESRISLGADYTFPRHRDYFKTAIAAYNEVKKEYPFLKYSNPSIKKSGYGRLGNYMGFLGYYNPFTGEAQVNTAFLPFQQPYVACHEIAHQLGYASESEANFVGYLAATASKDLALNYSVYFDMFNYANRELFYRDSTAARNNYKLLDTLVKKDIISVRKFLYKYKNPFEPVVKLFYDQYLKANNQVKGMQSYNEVVGWLIAYRKKFGRL
jgi:hypothetical protein